MPHHTAVNIESPDRQGLASVRPAALTPVGRGHRLGPLGGSRVFRRRSLLAAWGLGLGWVLGFPGGPAPAASPKERFLAEYPAAAEKLRAFYGQVRGEGTLTITRLKSDPELKGDPAGTVRQYTIRFAVDSGRTRVEEIAESDAEDQPRGSVMAVVTTPDTRFKVTKSPDQRSFVLTDISHDVAAPSIIAGYIEEFVQAPICLMRTPLSELIGSKGFVIRGVEETSDGERKLLRVQFQRAAPSPRDQETSGWFELSPEEGWVLKRYEYRFQSGLVNAGTVSFVRDRDGALVPKKVEYTSTAKRGASRINFRFREFARVPTPSEEFTLAAFGLPDIASVGRDRAASHPSSWFFGLAIAALAVAILLRYLGVRLERN